MLRQDKKNFFREARALTPFQWKISAANLEKKNPFREARALTPFQGKILTVILNPVIDSQIQSLIQSLISNGCLPDHLRQTMV